MTYYPRSHWRRLQPKAVNRHPITAAGGAVDLVVLHHTVTPDRPFFGLLQGIERDHINDVYDDFAYNGAAANAEDAYTDGRGPTVLGGATGNGIDPSSLSVVAVGDFHTSDGQDPSDLLVSNIAALVARWIKAGHVSPGFRMEPHRKFYATACCGDRLVARIPEITRLAKALAEGEDEDMTPMSDWWRTYNKLPERKYHPHVEFIQRGLWSLGLYRGDITGRKNLRTTAGWEAFEKATAGTDKNDTAGQKSWDMFLTAVFARENDQELPDGLVEAIDAAYVELAKAKFITG